MLDIIGVLLLGLLILQAQGIALDTSSSAESSLNMVLPSNYLGFSQVESLLLILLLSLICFSAKAVAAPFLQKKLLIFLGGVAANFSRNVMSRFLSQDIIFNQRRTTQENVFIVMKGSFLTFQGILGFFALLASELVIVIGMLILFLVIDLYVTIFVVIYLGLILFFLNYNLKIIIKKQNIVLNDAEINATTTIQETLNSYREVFVNQKIDYFAKVLAEDLQNSLKSRASLAWASLIPKYVLDTGFVLGIAIIGGFTYVFKSPEAAALTIGVFVLGASRIMPSLLRFNTGIQGVQNCSDASNRFYNLIAELNDSEKKNTDNTSVFQSRAVDEYLIEVDSLDFKYPGATEVVLDDVSFEVKQGEFLAVVGPTGSGKSTLVDLLIGVIEDPTRSIHVLGATPREKIKSNPGLIGYVPQNVSLFTRSLSENIALGVPFNEIDQVRIERAVERAALSELVNSLPLGLNTLVGQNGYNFSGGQKQRIGLARAFYTNPQILILDEATSALDAETEHQISQMLSSLAGKLTLIVVAHRLATVQKADKVLYIGGGGFSAVGSFEELRIQVPNFDVQAKLLGL